MAANMRRILDRHRVTSGKGFRLKHHDPADTGGRLMTQSAAEDMVAQDVQRLSSLHDRLYARNEWALLCVFQAMDAAGKDSAIKHVMTGVNPQGVQVTPFKAPGPEELAHDFLWRINRALPQRGTSASSTAATTRRCWQFASTRSSSPVSICRSNCKARSCGTSGSRRSRTSSAT